MKVTNTLIIIALVAVSLIMLVVAFGGKIEVAGQSLDFSDQIEAVQNYNKPEVDLVLSLDEEFNYARNPINGQFTEDERLFSTMRILAFDVENNGLNAKDLTLELISDKHDDVLTLPLYELKAPINYNGVWINEPTILDPAQLARQEQKTLYVYYQMVAPEELISMCVVAEGDITKEYNSLDNCALDLKIDVGDCTAGLNNEDACSSPYGFGDKYVCEESKCMFKDFKCTGGKRYCQESVIVDNGANYVAYVEDTLGYDACNSGFEEYTQVIYSGDFVCEEILNAPVAASGYTIKDVCTAVDCEWS
jgi:hypothetical protein